LSQNHKTYVVTGGAGFIGSHLIKKLIKDKHNIVLIDDLSSGQLDNIKEIDHAEIITKKVQKTDLNDLGKIDGIFHLAAQSSVPFSLKNYFISSNNNLASTIKIFDWAANLDIPVVFASSSAIYGNLPVGNDLDNNFEILSPYAQDKLTLEHYAKMTYDVFGVRSIGLRLFNVYGPKQDPLNPYSGVITIFINQILKSQPVTVNGGFQTRDFVYVKDVVDVLIKSIEILHKNKFFEVLNVGTGKSVTIDNLLTKIIHQMGVKTKITRKELPEGDPEKSGGNYTKLEELLKINLKTFTSLRDGLTDTINYFTNQMHQL
jgi:UDP-glucose 4-epimerase